MVSEGEVRVLAIQSHVVSGYVGNKCCVFPLQLFGFDVDAINSVQFSNNTSYPTWKGSVMTGEQLLDLVEGLKANNLTSYSHLVTGYIGSLSFLEAIVKVIEILREKNPKLHYVCDPVMGDDGRLYVPQDMVSAYRAKVVPLASIVTPNQFEAELITQRTIRTEADALQACRDLHGMGPATVVITSFAPEGVTDELLLVASSVLPQEPSSFSRLRIRIPRVNAYFTGTGDLMTALLLAWLEKHPRNLRHAVESALAGLQGVLQRTHEMSGLVTGTTEKTAEVAKARELRLIQSQGLLTQPQISLLAESLEGM